MLNLLDTLGHKGGEVLDVDASVRTLPQLQPLLVVLAEQVAYLFLVYLQVRRPDEVLLVLRPRDVREDVVEGVWNNASLFQAVADACEFKVQSYTRY